MIAYDALMTIREQRDATPEAVRETFEAHSENLGYALLLKRYVDDPRDATEEQITLAADDTVPGVAPLFWAFRLMVGLGFSFIAVMAFFFVRASFYQMRFPRWSLYAAVAIIPTPWIAAELGWFVAEFGRQPWTVDGVLPTALSASHLSVTDLLITLAGFVTFLLDPLHHRSKPDGEIRPEGSVSGCERNRCLGKLGTRNVCAALTARILWQPPWSKNHDPL